jgi:hypothetical protein
VYRNCTLRMEVIFVPVTSEHSPITNSGKPKKTTKTKLFLKLDRMTDEVMSRDLIIYLKYFIRKNNLWCFLSKFYTSTFSHLDLATPHHSNGFYWIKELFRSIQEIVTFYSPRVMSRATINIGPDYMKIWTISLTATHSLISLLATTFNSIKGSTKIFTPLKYKSLQNTTENIECLIVQMQNYILLFTLLTFSSVAVFAGLQEVINVANSIAKYTKN